ncbi:MAG: hypothetical protein J5709_07370 [Bacteroidales bacterium]|nr:hypothetical protein [Bacteroidales bacterium]
MEKISLNIKIRAFILVLLTSMPGVIESQIDCYQKLKQRGEEAYNTGNFSKAIEFFKSADECPEKPSNNDLHIVIESCEAEIKKRNNNIQFVYYNEYINVSSEILKPTSLGGTYYIDFSSNAEELYCDVSEYWISCSFVGLSTIKIRVSSNNLMWRHGFVVIYSGNTEKKIYIYQDGRDLNSPSSLWGKYF